MSHLGITMNLDIDPWTDLLPDPPEMGTIDRVGLLPEGMASGRPAVILLVLMPDGSKVAAQASWAQWKLAMSALGAAPVAQLDALEHGE